LLSTDNEQEAQQIASRLEQINSLRQRIEEKIYQSAKEMITSGQMWPEKKSLVLASPDWHPGVIGIVASRLTEEFYRPTILIACQEKIAKGSGRSITSFPLFSGLKKCQQWMEAFGGHAQAAGLLIRPEHIPSFAEAFEEIVRHSCEEEDFIPALPIDAWAQLRQIDELFFPELEAMAPFGPGNPEPVLATTDLEVLESRLVGKNHMRLRLQQGRLIREAIAFNMADLHPLSKERIKLAFSPTVGFYQGKKTLELKVVDIQKEER
jgi:single-stranded-DNA-specific exonuclease